jgi:hypothetical protein
MLAKLLGSVVPSVRLPSCGFLTGPRSVCPLRHWSSESFRLDTIPPAAGYSCRSRPSPGLRPHREGVPDERKPP